MAAASEVKIVLQAGAIPVAQAAVDLFGQSEALQAALHGGEDYELLFVSGPGRVDPAYFMKRFNLELTHVGRVELGDGVWLEQPSGSVERLERGGFDHFGDLA